MVLINKKIYITKKFYGQRLDKIISLMLPEYSRSLYQKLIKEGKITINNQTVKHNIVIKKNETVLINAYINNNNHWIPENIHINIVYEDNDIIIINKKKNFVVHPGAGNDTGTLANGLLYYLPTLIKLPRYGIIHRLDKDTTGLLIIAKNILSYNILTKELFNRTITRKYKAIVQGNLNQNTCINKPISRNIYHRLKMSVSNQGKIAITYIKPIEDLYSCTLVKCILHTGRTHQIRVHCEYINYPILGDKLYNINTKKYVRKKNDDIIKLIDRQCLHAYKLVFNHPISKKKLTITIDIPQDMQNVIQYLKTNKNRNKF